ncbi:MAG: hypothetical protein ACJAQ3_004354 [Planctomycetota bacterium]|jgi:hypothetical protein
MKITTLSLALIVLSPMLSAQAELEQIFSPAPYANERFGQYLDHSGNTLVVGTSTEAGVGTCYVFESQGGIWSHTASLIPAPLDPSLGVFTTALEGDFLFVSAADFHGAGRVYGFERGAGGWSQTVSFTGSGPTLNESFGQSLSLHSDLLIAGAPSAVAQGISFAGAVYVYNRSGGTWTETERLESSAPTQQDYLGTSVDTDGETIVAGAHFGDVNGVKAGTATVWEKDPAGTWMEVARLAAPDGADSENFGIAVAVMGNRIAVGARFADGEVGAVYVFRRALGIWTFESKLVPSFAQPYSRAGSSVEFDGTRLLVGAQSGDFVTGYEHLAGEWVETLSFQAHDSSGNTTHTFGSQIALDGDVIAVADPDHDEACGGAGGCNAGAIYFFRLEGYSFETCLGAPNSSGVPCTLSLDGSLEVSDNNLRLMMAGGPAGQFGITVTGQDPMRLALGDGELCISPFHPGLTRLPPVVRLDPAGSATLTLDLAAGPAGSAILGGSRHYFQLIYRDDAPGGSGINLSSALGVTFLP